MLQQTPEVAQSTLGNLRFSVRGLGVRGRAARDMLRASKVRYLGTLPYLLASSWLGTLLTYLPR